MFYYVIIALLTIIAIGAYIAGLQDTIPRHKA